MKRLCAIIVLASLSVTGCSGGPKPGDNTAVAFVPKIKAIPYFMACRRGAEEAGKELGIRVVYDGPTEADSNLQIDFLTNRIASGEFGCLAVACTERDRLAPTLQEARDKGMPVVTFDADTAPDSRDFFVNMASYDGVSQAMVDALMAGLGPNPKGKIGILTSSLEAPNQAEWAKRIKVLIAKVPGLEVMPEVVHGEDRVLGVKKARAMIAEGGKELIGIIGLTSVAVPAAAEAVRLEKLAGKVVVTGVSTPRDMLDYVTDDTVKAFVLWSPVDLGYLTVHVCHLAKQKKMPRSGSITAGRLGKIEVSDGEVMLGKPLTFTKKNIGDYDF